VKYADDLVLLPKKEIIQLGTDDRLNEIGICYGIEMNVEKMRVMRISRQPSPVHMLPNQKTTKKMWNI
jgi:hypothetical protein